MSISRIINTILTIVNRQEDTDFIELLARRLQDRINDLCRQYTFQFLDVIPDPSILQYIHINKPVDISDFITVNNFFAQGWLGLTSGKGIYPFKGPVINYDMPMGETIGYFGDIEYIKNQVFSLQKVQCLYDVKCYDTSGQYIGNIAVEQDPNTFYSAGDFSQDSGQPAVAMIHNRGNYSELVLSPIPGDYFADSYIIGIHYKLLEFPELMAPGDTNVFLDEYPEIAINLGVEIAAQHFEDDGMLQRVKFALYGNPADKKDAGQIGTMIRVNRSLTRKSTLPTVTGISRTVRGRHYQPNGSYYQNRW